MPWWPTRTTEPAAAVITLLSDYGRGGLYVGLLHGVIERVAPGARVIDLAHDVPPGDVLGGALALADALAYLPVGIHVAVVDPGVGTARRALALRCRDGRVLIGPDNGVLSLAVAAGGGVEAAVDISHSPLVLEPVSATFHGRDIFAPVAGALAAGQNLLTVGSRLEEPLGLIELTLPAPAQIDGGLEVTVSAVDAFGNLALLAPPADDGSVAGVEPGGIISVGAGGRRLFARYGATFADVGSGRLLLHVDSTGRLSLAVNGASATALLGVRAGDRVRLSR